MSLIDVRDWRALSSPLDIKLWRERWPDFSPDEIACRTGELCVSFQFMDELQSLRAHLGKPMHITSGCRTTVYNLQVGGKSGSFHLCDVDRKVRGTLAVDVAALEGAYRGELFSKAWQRGWTVGWNARRGFLHLDKRALVDWKQTTFDY